MKITSVLLSSVVSCVAVTGLAMDAEGGKPALTDAERAAITRPALDYAESYYEGDAARMEQALHPDLAKRMISVDEGGRARLDHMSSLRLVQVIRAGSGKSLPPERHKKDVEIFDVYNGRIASLRVEMDGWVDYLHVGKFGDKWLIVNVLWEPKPRPTTGGAREEN